MLNKNNLSIVAIVFSMFFLGCKEFIEPSIEKKNVVLLAPADKTEGKVYSQTFWWEEVEDALKYRLQVVTPDFNKTVRLVLDTLISTNKFKFTLDPGTYEWRVSAQNGSSSTPYTKASFIIHPTSIKEQQVQLVSPSNNLLTNQPKIVFKWLPLFGANQYTIQVDTDNFQDETNLFVNKTISGQEFTVNFTDDNTYQWRVKAKDDKDESKWSVVQNVTFDKTPPGKVFLTSPTNNQSVTKPVTLRWEATATAKRYQLYIYKSDGTSLYDANKYPVFVTTTSYVFNEGMSGEKIFWELRALDEAGNTGAFSELRSFVIQ